MAVGRLWVKEITIFSQFNFFNFLLERGQVVTPHFFSVKDETPTDSLFICGPSSQSTRCDSAMCGPFSHLPPQFTANPPQQSCFSTALDVAGCVIDGLMDPTCACTSYLFTNSLGGHDTGIDYARYLCIDLKPASGCNEHDLGLFDDSLNDICYNKE